MEPAVLTADVANEKLMRHNRLLFVNATFTADKKPASLDIIVLSKSKKSNKVSKISG